MTLTINDLGYIVPDLEGGKVSEYLCAPGAMIERAPKAVVHNLIFFNPRRRLDYTLILLIRTGFSIFFFFLILFLP